MANKREFKKYIDAMGASICEEMMLAYYNVEGVDKDLVAKAIEKMLGAIGKAKNNANVFFDRGARAFEDHKEYKTAKAKFFKALFNKIETEFNTEVNDAVKDLNKALPASVKEDNKAAVK